MHRPLAMGIDVGTGSVKAGLFLPGADSPAAYASQAYAQEPVPSRPTWAEVDTERWRTALLLAVGRLPAGLRAEVGSVGVTGLFPALIAMDSEGQALRPAILYSDRRSTAELEDLRARGLDRAIERVAGGEPTPGTTSALSYLWLSSNEPEVDAQARWFGHGTTWLGAWLTGQIAIDASNASMTGLYDTRAGGWSDALMAELAIDPARWPPIVGSGRPIGGLRPEVAGLLGLPVGTPVTLAGGDTACAAVGAGCADSGRCFLSSGTTDTLCLCLDEFRYDPRLFCAAHALPELWLSMAPTMYTGGALDWCGRLLGTASEDPAELVLALAESLPAGGGGVVFLPYLMGERSPVRDPLAKGVLHGLGPATGPAEVARAVVDGGALAIRTCLDALRGTSEPPAHITIVGRPASSAVLNRARAAATGVPVVALEFEEATLLGAAACGAHAAGLISRTGELTEPYLRHTSRCEPDPQAAAAYERLLPLYTDLYAALKERDLFARLPHPG